MNKDRELTGQEKKDLELGKKIGLVLGVVFFRNPDNYCGGTLSARLLKI